MRKVFLDELPRYKNNVSWKNSIGYKVKFVYDEIEDYFEIVDYDLNNQKIAIKYNNIVNYIFISSVNEGNIGVAIGIRGKNFKYEIGQTFINDKRNYTIIDRKTSKKEKITKRNGKIYKSIENKKYYKIHCNICGFNSGEHYKNGEYKDEYWIEESNITKGQGCPCCASRIIVTDINSIYATDKWMIEIGMSEEDAKKYAKYSNVNVKVKCPYCHKYKTTSIPSIYGSKSIGCNCNVYTSYPNKFVGEFFNQLLKQNQIKDYQFEYSIKNKKYDIYVTLNNNETLIVENNGEQHYYQSRRKGARPLKEEQKNDAHKCWLAYKNGINNYLQLDCRNSDLDFIKNNIINSILNLLFDLSNIDWLQCEKYALSNLTYEICKYFNENRCTTKELSILFKRSYSNIRKHLNKGTKLGWCNYTGNKKKVLVYDLNMNYIDCEEGVNELDRKSEEKFGIHFCSKCISSVCLGEKHSHKGYIFKYAD